MSILVHQMDTGQRLLNVPVILLALDNNLLPNGMNSLSEGEIPSVANSISKLTKTVTITGLSDDIKHLQVINIASKNAGGDVLLEQFQTVIRNIESLKQKDPRCYLIMEDIPSVIKRDDLLYIFFHALQRAHLNPNQLKDIYIADIVNTIHSIQIKTSV